MNDNSSNQALDKNDRPWKSIRRRKVLKDRKNFVMFAAMMMWILMLVAQHKLIHEKMPIQTSKQMSALNEKFLTNTSKPISPTGLDSLELRRSSPPRKMSGSNNTIFFLHIGKAGGTSVDALLKPILKRQGRSYKGNKHYDWSWIKQRGDPEKNADVITFLRHPVSRAASQFYFSKRLRWAKKMNATFLYQTFDEYLTNPGAWGQLTLDGLYCNYLSGTIGERGSIATDGNETERKQYLRSNITANAIQAAENLDKTVFFGLLEDIPRSMKMLQLSLDLEEEPSFPSKNVNKKSQNISVETALKLESTLQGDLFVYNYAKLLFEARWEYLTGISDHYTHPQFPPWPKS